MSDQGILRSCDAPHVALPPVLAVVIPCYNEEDALEITAGKLTALVNDLKAKRVIHPSSFVYFVDDGSGDRSWELITRLHNADNTIKGLKLSKNSGHQNAIFAGLMAVKDRVDYAITIDADLQDDISVIRTMIDKIADGSEIVYAVRRERPSDTIFKKYTALFFYKLMKLMGVDIVYNHADYRLASRRVLDELSNFREVNLFLRGIFPLLGFKNSEVHYDRQERFAGKSKYPLQKMILFALEGITSFSIAPVRIVTIAGFIVSIFSLFVSLWALLSFFAGKAIPGWASTVMPIYFLGGIQLLGIGILGEYIGKIYKEVKARPRFIKEVEIF